MLKSSYLLTASQTVGPFFHNCLLREGAHTPTLVAPDTAGERIRIEGRVLDGDGVGVPDAMLEIWQANAAGRYNHPLDARDLPLGPAFIGFGRTGTDAGGRFWFETVRPGPVPATKKVLERAGLGLGDIGLIELNEAFAAQSLAVLRAWGLDAADPRVNPNGGAVALGHPLGCSGVRILTTLVHELRRRPEAQFGLATMCIGVGQGIALVVEQLH